MPSVSIILPVFNGARYLDEAITSIINQTYEDWELIIINDGSVDQSAEIVRKYCDADDRVRYVEHQRNLGLVKSLNDGLTMTSGDFIARQDADDLSAPERIERMVDWLTQDPTVAMIGSNGYYIDETGNITQPSDFPTDHDTILQSIFNNKTPFFHGSWVFRRVCLEHVGAYNSLLYSGEDKDYAIRTAEQYKISTHPGKLYYYRVHGQAFTSGPSYRRKLMRRLVLDLALERRVRGKDSAGLTFGACLNEENIPDGIRRSVQVLSDAADWMEKGSRIKAFVCLFNVWKSGFGKGPIIGLCYFMLAMEVRAIWKKVVRRTRYLPGVML